MSTETFVELARQWLSARATAERAQRDAREADAALTQARKALVAAVDGDILIVLDDGVEVRVLADGTVLLPAVFRRSLPQTS